MTATADYKSLAERASRELADATADEAIRWTVETFGDDFIVASNMQDAVLIDLATKVKSDVDVLFLETGYHFPETIGTRDAVEAVYPGVKIVNAQAEQSVAEQDAEYGAKLHDRDPTLCCNLRKVVPLRKTLANYSAWVTGVRRVDAPTRANTPIVTWDDRNGLVKVNPIAAWTDDEFKAYIAEHGILENPLVSIGYLSIGCAPCTARVAPGADPRSGRWAGQSKTECGLHG
ncbi:phosphoadenosine phosphosulfate reductase [Amycolatopsis mediterranei S699]|uniref:Adenosine 5'-phosphosulfate reductase n=2 Tax=Amycolatopsis mediterranei TaxID=33910 RepID=A0A0H3DFG9_AMYMU|nr:phosphoadenylyl-sulfate reductase [Amycolatopsis mediterranei]ADJ48384.1 phosphoadenosine phosphosulfate reductase [Amycolatopsis mediterranei U32]AEK45305.1 phosphoadenosine phosphosulfate reductase [Amycolatopsis mediterranei S699]AFO80095.1 phosphoadenosine phosphosulfate reductase [Amycolatopsis mediterranei S699]AGT87223.1 phosphoadenosine phosphosulfate reductase [Amycolatopsis mediterranei RB]KDO10903.1 phosphoadenosine phosphosulfate reductase [Amycolatopsis mediterranei]